MFQVIDYGSGRGYLGVQLAHDYQRNVLGIESCEATAHSGARRQELLTRYQRALTGNEHYRTTSTLVNSETNFQELFSDLFQSPSSSFLLCGLHACGSLSCSLIHHFVSNASVRALVNVACCYHLLEEKFAVNPFTRRSSVDELASTVLFLRVRSVQRRGSLQFPVDSSIDRGEDAVGPQCPDVSRAILRTQSSRSSENVPETFDGSIFSSVDIERRSLVSSVDASDSP